MRLSLLVMQDGQERRKTDIPISTWEVSLNDESQPWTGEVAAMGDHGTTV